MRLQNERCHRWGRGAFLRRSLFRFRKPGLSLVSVLIVNSPLNAAFFFFKILSTRLFHITYLEVILLQWSTQNRSFYLFLFFNTFRLGSLQYLPGSVLLFILVTLLPNFTSLPPPSPPLTTYVHVLSPILNLFLPLIFDFQQILMVLVPFFPYVIAFLVYIHVYCSNIQVHDDGYMNRSRSWLTL